MPYKDPEKQKKYQKEWIAKRREDYFKNKKCKICGSTKDLILHHKKRNKETPDDHKIWSWSKDRREKELAKCEVWCRKCHEEHHGNHKGDSEKKEKEK